MKQRKINPEAIAALKRVMPDIETRKMFIDECIKANGKDFESKWKDDITIHSRKDFYNSLIYAENSFRWTKTKDPIKWRFIFLELNEKEGELKIFLI